MTESPKALTAFQAAIALDPAYAAAMDPTGSTWAVGSWVEIALCDFDKEQRPPGLDWVVSAVTFSRSGRPLLVRCRGARLVEPARPHNRYRASASGVPLAMSSKRVKTAWNMFTKVWGTLVLSFSAIGACRPNTVTSPYRRNVLKLLGICLLRSGGP